MSELTEAEEAARVAEVLGLKERCPKCGVEEIEQRTADDGEQQWVEALCASCHCHGGGFVPWTCADANEVSEAVRAMDCFQRHSYVTQILRGTGYHSTATVINPMLATPAQHLAALYVAVKKEKP